MTDGEPEAYKDDTLRSIGISPRQRLEHIEDGIKEISEKLDVRLDAHDKRLTAIETVQSGQASTAEFVKRARELADEAATKAATLADEKNKAAADLAESATAKAIALADDQKKLVSAIEALGARLAAFDKKFWTLTGVGTAAVFVSGILGYVIHR